MKGTQHTYIALLRGINVGGHAVIKMADVKKLFESCGLADVTTYIQSGNVIFSAKQSGQKQLIQVLEKKFASSIGQNIKIFVLTPEELKKTAAKNPFEPKHFDKEQRCHLMFLSREPGDAQIKTLMKLKSEEYKFHVKGRVMYYAYSKKYDGIRRMIDFEKVLETEGTSRSWKVVDRLIELSGLLQKSQ